MKTGFFLAFDYGLKRIGVAVGQEVTLTATPLEMVKCDQGKADWGAIDKLIGEWSPEALVVGLPLKTDGSDQSVTKFVRRFSNQLRERFKLDVHFVDERYTSMEAKQQLFDQGGYKKLKKANVDSLAAKLMLEQWFNSM